MSASAPPVRPPALEADSSYAWWRLAATLALMTVGSSVMYVVAVVLPAVQADFGVQRSDASLPYTLLMIGFGFGGILMGRLADRFGVFVPLCIGAAHLHGILGPAKFENEVALRAGQPGVATVANQSGSIGALLRASTDDGVRWNTCRLPAQRARCGTHCTAVAPVPMIATRLSASRSIGAPEGSPPVYA